MVAKSPKSYNHSSSSSSSSSTNSYDNHDDKRTRNIYILQQLSGNRSSNGIPGPRANHHPSACRHDFLPQRPGPQNQQRHKTICRQRIKCWIKLWRVVLTLGGLYAVFVTRIADRVGTIHHTDSDPLQLDSFGGSSSLYHFHEKTALRTKNLQDEVFRPDQHPLLQQHWTVPSLEEFAASSSYFDRPAFERHFQFWQEQQRRRQLQVDYQQQVRLSKRGEQGMPYYVLPGFQRQPPPPKSTVFRRHLSQELLVMVMADQDCPLMTVDSNNGITFNATDRLVVTVEQALQTNSATIIAYLPHHAGKEHCHATLYQALVATFSMALQSGQLHILTTPLQSIELDQPQRFHYTRSGLDHAYMADFCQQYSKHLCLFLQAGTRLKPNWRSNQRTMIDPPTKRPTLVRVALSEHRDYALEVREAYEAFQSTVMHDAVTKAAKATTGETVATINTKKMKDNTDLAVAHSFCFMNFIDDPHRNDPDFWLDSMELPTAVLMESSSLRRYSLALRSFLPYGVFSTSRLLKRFCTGLLWQSKMAVSPNALFTYEKKPGEQTQALTVSSSQQPFATIEPSSVPGWVAMDSASVGPQPTTNSTIRHGNGDYWMAIVIPTAWRHSTYGSAEEGNQYVVNCLKELLPIIAKDFAGQFKAVIVVVVSGRDLADQAMHRQGLESIFAEKIADGVMRMTNAPIDKYPTLQGLRNTYLDPEHRVRWRSQQNLDVSSAFFAAKGFAKYVMLVEDDSGFNPFLFQRIKTTIDRMTDNNNLGNPSGSRTWSQIRLSFGYSGVVIHDEDALVYGLLHYLLYDEKPCDLLNSIADAVRSGKSRDHPFRWLPSRQFITHRGRVSSLEGKIHSLKPKTSVTKGLLGAILKKALIS